MDDEYWDDIEAAIDVFKLYGDQFSELDQKMKDKCREMARDLDRLRLELDHAIADEENE